MTQPSGDSLKALISSRNCFEIPRSKDAGSVKILLLLCLLNKIFDIFDDLNWGFPNTSHF